MASNFSKADIAIVGISCRFPGAADQSAFWQNLKAGMSSIEEVPNNRWNWQKYWGDPQTESNKSNSKWGGFLRDVDCFDADFFSLSAREVERMDPQQRIMLELAWHCLEDAGIRPSTLSGEKVGVFLGAFNFDYKELQERSDRFSIEAHHSTGTATALIANRISYYFNFRGPSFPIDTACSSSLSAVHAAIQSLQQEECRYAIAGGVNLLLTPTRHISFSKTGMLSPTGSCKAFDESADGYVRGEGAGLLLLKPLDKAIEDKDHIYGIIKGSAVNHSGKTYSLTYPSADAQAQVIAAAQKNAGIDPATVGYIEAHGTGTPKGDPIEFQGLTAAFRAVSDENAADLRTGYCGISSVKTNIGHLEAAAGVAGIIKVLLSMQHRQLPGLQNFSTLNHRISLEGSPFYLVTGLQEWPVLRDEDGCALPRRAGVSSFGFGGTNAHVVLEEFNDEDSMAEPDSTAAYYFICLSAKTAADLEQKEKGLANWLKVAKAPAMADLCRTLSVGREHFAKRSVIIAETVPQLVEKLVLLSSVGTAEGCYRNLDGESDGGSSIPVDKDIFEYLNGNEPDWEKSWFGVSGRRISMPAYPFAKKSFWIPGDEAAAEVQHVSSRRLSGEEIFLRDHIVEGKRVLPAVIYLEMVRSALGAEGQPVRLEHVIWARPVIAGDAPVTIDTRIHYEDQDRISFEVLTGEVMHCSGNARFIEYRELPRADMDALRSGKELTREECYLRLSAMGLSYGPSNRCIQKLYLSGGRILADLAAPDGAADVYLHPGLTDAALQAVLLADGGEDGLFLPFALDRIEIMRPCTAVMRAVIDVKVSAVMKKADISLCDEAGIVCVKIEGCSFKRVSEKGQTGIDYFKKLLSAAIKRPASAISADAAMETYGIDSIMVMEMTRRMEAVFGPLPKTLFFEYQNIRELSGYFMEHHAEKLSALVGKEERGRVTVEPGGVDQGRVGVEKDPGDWESRILVKDDPLPEEGRRRDTGGTDIAIIGLAGRYPQADDLEAFWSNLKNGKDCITEIPGDRWDYRVYFDKDKEKEGKSYSKWGGFLNDVDKFDPLFFNISPMEAERMDPQERLFLQCVYETIEDAGYTRQSLSQGRRFGLGNMVGVFVGVMYEEYQLLGAEESLRGRPVALWGLPSSIANRVSYYCDFHGPSMAIDTMCSSSLTAIHLACESIVRGKCELAIAGGVNLSVHPNKYLFLSQGRFASSKGRCESFGIGGDGYVPGEGVGSVLLKPLSRAIADGDHIYGVIKSTAVNHGGKTNGYTVPNLKAQAAVISHAFAEAGIDPRSISYIEAHGTGTSLGDPIEIAGLDKAMREYTGDRQFCSIGSAKSNIGHCESAAGIAGLTKVLLQLKYRQLVPSLHSENLNEHIDFSASCFRVQQRLESWSGEYPRRAGISSFGAGGANAHIVVEEFRSDASDITHGQGEPALILLSAMDDDRLQMKVKRLSVSLGTASLTDLAYTLQVGREAMPARLALIVDSVGELADKLRRIADGVRETAGVFYGEVSAGREAAEIPALYFEKRDHETIAGLWVSGGKVDWGTVYRNRGLYRRVSLPTYPFKKQRYWLDTTAGPVLAAGTTSSSHPLLHENISDLSGQRYRVSFAGDEFYLKDHVVNGQAILPAVAFLEMIREAVQRSTEGLGYQMANVRLKDIHWIQALHVEERGRQVHIELFMEDNGDIFFEIHNGETQDAATRETFCNGLAVAGPSASAVSFDISLLHAECVQKTISGPAAYELFEQAGFRIGPSMRGLEQVHIGEDKILAAITTPGDDGRFFLSPGLMDAMMQVTLLWRYEPSSPVRMHVPVTVDEVNILQAVSNRSWVVVTKRNDVFDIDVLSEAGALCVRLKGVEFRILHSKHAETLLLVPGWVRPAHTGVDQRRNFGRHLIVVCGSWQGLVFPGAELLIFDGATADTLSEDAVIVFEKIRDLLKVKERGDLLVQVLVPDTSAAALYAAFSGLLMTARKENPRFFGQVIRVSGQDNIDSLTDKLRENYVLAPDKDIRYIDGHREVARWNLLEAPVLKTGSHPWKEGSVYLITGGAGGLGLLFARDIVHHVKDVTIVLTGRSVPDESRSAAIALLRQTGARILYMRADVGEESSVRELIHTIIAECGGLNGIIHSAGVIQDGFLIRKTVQEWRAVAVPKIDGVRHLDQATRDICLDFFIFFSSVAGALGNIGQADYATGNAFMDGYAAYRNRLVEEGKRYGRTLSVNWPLWEAGGMQIGQEAEAYLLESMGMVPLSTESGIDALHRAFSSGHSQVMVASGERDKIIERVIGPDRLSAEAVAGGASSADVGGETWARAIQYFTNLLSSVIKLAASNISPEVSMSEYGIDSVMVMKVTSQLEKIFGPVSKTLFFEYQNIRQLTGYFLEGHYNKLAAVLGIDTKGEGVEAVEVPKEKRVRTVRQRGARYSSSGASGIAGAAGASGPIDIAIVGVAGRYPQADNLEAFWANLRDGRDCVTEIPGSRWDYRLYFDADRGKEGKTYSKWGGFINGVDRFDPLFFNISPREAELLDPQERLFLQCAYETMEDAGYSRQVLASGEGEGQAGRVGVYVGVMYEEYQLFGAAEGVHGRNIALFGNPSSIANRVSFFYNFNGPSLAVDTMCSSSLTAIHLACQGIFNGDCQSAIAGGVNISIHPNKYLLLAQGKFISGKGRCESFGIGGEGYVPSEGVGAVYLKPLTQAIKDGDHVYGVIKATAINHGGKTNGYTVPNPNAQAEVIKRAFERSGIDARTISYLEAHGTGTSLGDPIEIAGLKKTYREYTNDNAFCAIGSVKSNIGHGESAAGIAGLTKLLLQLQHRQLAPSLHSKELNPNIDFANSPFVVQQELSVWHRPFVVKNGVPTEYPRRAGLSSFGAGGANAHLIVEEYDGPERDSGPADARMGGVVMIVLSAKTSDQLKEVAGRFLKALKSGRYSDADLIDIAYTLQMGRDALEQRVAMIVRTLAELTGKLADLMSGQDLIDDLYRGSVERDNSTIEAFATDEELKDAMVKWIEKKKYTKLCHFWIKGLALDWTLFYRDLPAGKRPMRLSLPTYPFAQERYWIPRSEGGAAPIRERGPQELVLLKPIWKDADTGVGSARPIYSHHLIVLVNTGHEDIVQKGMVHARIVNLSDPAGTGMAAGFQENVLVILSEIQYFLQGQHEGSILIQVVTPAGNAVVPGIDALLRTAHLENPRITGQLIQAAAGMVGEDLIMLLTANSHAAGGHISYANGRRQVSGLEEYDNLTAGYDLPKAGLWKQNGVYVITGGAGGIGLTFAEEIIRRAADVTIVLVGRSALSSDKTEAIRSLSAGGRARVEYRRADVSDRSSVRELIEGIQRTFGGLNGIIYSAGVTRDNYLLRTTRQEWKEVFAPKVNGLVNLDEVTAGIGLDHFIVFSSIAGVFGNPGQANYATANAFMDGYVRYRNVLTAGGARSGTAISISWPLWKEGGMHVYKEVEQEMEEKMGMVAIGKDSALEAFYRAVSSGLDQLVVMYGNRMRLLEKIHGVKEGHTGDAALPKGDLLPELKSLFGEVVKLPPERVDEKEEFRAYGLNSVMIVQLNQLLEKKISGLSKTLFYEHQNLSSIAEYLLKHHGGVFEKSVEPIAAAEQNGAADEKGKMIGAPALIGLREPVAIIGMSGRYPMATSLRAYWENLRSGRDCISEIPADRWSLDDFYISDRGKAVEQGKSYSRWGGFLEGFAEFDPLFFNISPREAATMDPQERLFLQACWEVLEDAGYTKEEIARKYHHNVGVFAGVTKTGFELYNIGLQERGEDGLLRTSFSSVANRVSYHLNLRGPSMPIDTMCSSSLTAIHEACEHLYRGDCALAIAGGVNLYLHPFNYTALCSQGFLSEDGKCRSFGDGGSGFVPGEGVGAVLLKPLSRAVADGDDIYAVIRGTSINHGGRTSGYTVPNPVAQEELIRCGLERAGVDARAISYVEAHGTGTLLGDPIEVTGLSQAFRKDTADRQFCAIGSVKSNIGHLEAAAGIAGITKIVLQMKHRMLVPSLHAGVLNKNINFDQSPFYIQQGLRVWERPVVQKDGVTKEVPRLACISSFGAGGANAYVVIEEYISPVDPVKPTDMGLAFIVLSAMSEKQLIERARQLLQFIDEETDHSHSSLLRMGYTLQVGREEMEQRFSINVSSFEELREKLRSFIAGRSFNEEAAVPVSAGRSYKRMHLPVYPFEKTPYWLPRSASHAGRKKEEMVLREKKWLFTSERWVPSAFAEGIDWTGRLRQQAGKRICIICSIEEEGRASSSLLKKLASATGLAPFEVAVLSATDVTAAEWERIQPDVVMFFGPARGSNNPLLYAERAISHVYAVSQSLLLALPEKFIRLYYVYDTGDADPRLDCEALSGFFRSAVLENSQHVWTSIQLDDTTDLSGKPQLLLREWLSDGRTAGVTLVEYKRDLRFVKQLSETAAAPFGGTIFRQGGHYIIAGGMGPVGTQLMEELAKHYKATLAIVSKRAPDTDRVRQCEKLERLGATVSYHVADVTDMTALRAVYNSIKQEMGTIHGVINLTRVHESKGIASKDLASFLRTSQVRIEGTLHLDELTKDEPLDLFMSFGSMGAYGARGDSDYAFSMAFQHAFTHYRNRLRRDGRRYGAAIAFCWGPWEGNRVQPAGFDLIDMQAAFPLIEASDRYEDGVIGICAVLDELKARAFLGLQELAAGPAEETVARTAPQDNGFGLFIGKWEEEQRMGRRITIDDVRRVIPVEALQSLDIALVERIYRLCFDHQPVRSAGLSATDVAAEMAAIDAGVGYIAAVADDRSDSRLDVREILMQVLQIDQIDEERPLQSYGLDSILAVRASAKLGKRLKCEVRPGWLIEFPTVKALARHLNGLLQPSST